MCKSTILIIWTTGLLVFSTGSAMAETYKCQTDGKTTYSDIPCAAKSTRVDSASDKVSKSQKLQAEIVDQKNHNQLSDLQYQAARTRQTPASIYILNSANSPPPNTSSRTIRSR